MIHIVIIVRQYYDGDSETYLRTEYYVTEVYENKNVAGNAVKILYPINGPQRVMIRPGGIDRTRQTEWQQT